MADKYIGDLANAEPNLTDYLVGVNGTDAYKALVSDVAKKVIESYAGTTLMGTAQSVKNAFNGSNSLISANNIVGANARQGWTALTSGQDLNSLTTVGIYYAPSGSVATSILNLPETPTVYGLFLLHVEHTGNNNQYIKQTITMPYATVIDGTPVVERTYKRQTVNRGSAWTDWIFEPTRAEVNSIANDGAKNLLQNKASSVTKQGLTYTVNENGSVSVSGTAIANSYLELSVAKTFASATIMSGCPSNTGLTIDVITPSQTYVDSGSGVVIPANATITAIRLRVANGTSVTNATFYPMLRHASIIDDTYVPYGMSNAELTAKIPQFSQSQGQALGSSTTTITLTTGAYLLTLYHMGNDVNGLYLINVYSGTSGSRRVVPILANANMEITESAYTLSIKNNSSNNANYSLLQLGDRM